jgi:hypothetical protein
MFDLIDILICNRPSHCVLCLCDAVDHQSHTGAVSLVISIGKKYFYRITCIAACHSRQDVEHTTRKGCSRNTSGPISGCDMAKNVLEIAGMVIIFASSSLGAGKVQYTHLLERIFKPNIRQTFSAAAVNRDRTLSSLDDPLGHNSRKVPLIKIPDIILADLVSEFACQPDLLQACCGPNTAENISPSMPNSRFTNLSIVRPQTHGLQPQIAQRRAVSGHQS